jgi:hypothetical protein
MPIADKKYFTKKHVEKNRQDAPAFLAEQAIHCLELVSQLVKEGLDFTFKGGNSLLVLLEKPRRYSIDVDITTGEPMERIDECLVNAIKNHGVFTRFEKRQHKTKPNLPMTSYNIYYPSHFTDEKETFIMLDVQLKKSTYPTVKKQVCCTGLYKSDQQAELPKVSSLISDKLLTLGPNTLGIPLNKKKEAQRLKHSHDVSLLAEQKPDVNEMRKSMEICKDQENALQEKSLSLKDVLKDTLSYCALPISYPEEPKEEPLAPALAEIVRGRSPFADHLLSKDYSWQRLQKDLAKSALCLCAVYLPHISSNDFHRAIALDDTGSYWKQISLWFGKDPLAL